MIIPEILEDQLQLAEKAVMADKHHQLLPIYRRAIYQTIQTVNAHEARIVRANLAILVVRHLLPLWDQVRSYVPVPRQLLSTAEGVLKGVVSHNDATALIERNYDTDFSYNDDVPVGNAYFVLLAAVQALRETVGGTIGFDDIDITEDTTDSDLDDWCTDTAGWGAIACAGKVWELDNNPNARRVFWKWWLNYAIPKTYQII